MTTDLSKRLRNICDRCCNAGNLPLIPLDELRSYADIIDQQVAEIKRLKKKLGIKLDDYYGTPCEQIRHRQEIDDMRSQRDEWRRRAAVLRLHVPEQIWPLFVREFPESAQWFEEN